MSKKTFPCLRIVLNHLKVIYRYNCTKMLQMYLSQPLWKFIAFWCWRSICITIGQIMGNFHYNPINISRVIKKNNFFAFLKCPHTMHWILNVSILYIFGENCYMFIFLLPQNISFLLPFAGYYLALFIFLFIDSYNILSLLSTL